MTPRRPLEASGASPGTPWGPRRLLLKSHCSHLGRSGSLFGRPGGVQGPSGEGFGTLLGDFWPSKGAFL